MALEISTDRARLNRDLIYDYLCTQSYWAKGRSRETMDKAIDNSLCFGAYEDGAQVGFARVVSDFCTFAYIGDVFVDPPAQGRGVGQAIVAAILAEPSLTSLRRMVLATADAHTLYTRFGFTPLDDVPNWLQLRRGGI